MGEARVICYSPKSRCETPALFPLVIFYILSQRRTFYMPAQYLPWAGSSSNLHYRGQGWPAAKTNLPKVHTKDCMA